MKKRYFGFLIFLVIVSFCFGAERQGTVESFLSRGKGKWVSPRDRTGNVVLFIFQNGDLYCGGEVKDNLSRTCGHYEVYAGEGQYAQRYTLKLTDQTGKILNMPLELISEFIILINGQSLRRIE